MFFPLSPMAPEAAFVGGRALLVWTTAASGSAPRGQVWSDVSADGGATWGEDMLVQEVRGGSASRTQLVADRDGKVARLVFHAGPFTKVSHIYYTAFDANGAWRSTGDAITRITPKDGQFSNPRVAVDTDGSLYVAYEDAQKRIVLSRSTDDGATWSADPQVVAAVTEQTSQARVRYPQIVASDGAVYVMWELWGDVQGVPTGIGKTMVETETVKRGVDLFVRRAHFAR